MATAQGVFSSVKDALLQRRDKVGWGDGREHDLYKRDIVNLAGAFLFGSNNLQQRVEILATISCVIHTGGHEVALFSTRLLPHVILIMEEDILQRPLLVQIVRTLSAMCNHNETAVDELRKHPKCIRRLVEMVGDVSHLVDCRWACYLLTITTVNSNGFLCDIMANKFPELRGNLEKASKAPVPWDPWDGWSCNLARRLRKLYGWYHPKNKPKSKAPPPPPSWRRRSTVQSIHIGAMHMLR